MTLKYLFIVSFFLCFLSCDDGDIILTEFDFDEENLQLCDSGQNLVFFKITSDTNESISLQLVQDLSFLETNRITEVLQLNSTNIVTYRKFDATVSSNYFCSSIPPSSPLTILEYIAENGEAVITNLVTLDDNDGIDFGDEIPNQPSPIADTDADGIPNYLDIDFGDDINLDGIIDVYDTDLDGLPNFYDADDDGDNVLTSEELDIDNLDGNDILFDLDTDLDGIPNHLDADDDGDEVLTRNESTDGDLDPTNDIEEGSEIPNYLDAIIINEVINNAYIEHQYSLNADTSIILQDVTLVNENESIVQESLNLGTIINSINAIKIETPDFN